MYFNQTLHSGGSLVAVSLRQRVDWYDVKVRVGWLGEKFREAAELVFWFHN